MLQLGSYCSRWMLPKQSGAKQYSDTDGLRDELRSKLLNCSSEVKLSYWRKAASSSRLPRRVAFVMRPTTCIS